MPSHFSGCRRASERCQLGLSHFYGEGQECRDLYSAGVNLAVAESPKLESVYEKLAECAVLDTIPCPTSSTLFEAQVLTGALISCLSEVYAQAGDSCEGDACAPGLRCTGANDTMCGECEVSPEGWCEETYDCEALEFCDNETNLCVSFLADGASCTSDRHCLSGSCREDFCAQPGGVGDPCESADECDYTLKCASGSCRAPGGEGDACVDSTDCRFSFVCEASVCRRTGMSEISVGEPCRLYGCTEGAYCDFAEEICKSAAVGEPCLSTCGFERACLEGSCAELVPVGGQCNADSDCQSSKCIDSSCAADLGCGAF
jgi:hypothetical protein